MHSKLGGLIVGCCFFVMVFGGCPRHSRVDEVDGKAKAADKTWTEPLTGMEFVWIPGGCYQMGQTDAEQAELIALLGEEQYRQWFAKERPRHRVCVDGFWMGKYEVTVDEFRKFVRSSGYRTTAEKRDWSWCMTDQFERKAGINCYQPGFEQKDRHPVVHVSWFDAQAMAEWLSGASPGHFCLPSEAEWELACRGGAAATRFWGDDPEDACVYANGHDITANTKRGFFWPRHECRDGYAETAPVGSFQPNASGLYDMLGNVSEWCRDVFGEDAYGRHALNNPEYVEGGGSRAVRGGGWYSAPADMRCAVRRGNCPMNTDDALGFRLVRTERFMSD